MRDLRLRAERTAICLLAFLLAGMVVAGCASLSRHTGAVGTLPDVIDESSGLIAASSGTHFWTHNDSGDVARIFAIGFDGSMLGEFQIDDAMNSDWEAITSDRNGNLLIGDIGNNENQRRDLMIYVVPEPVEGEQSVQVERKAHFRYPEQRSFPDRNYFNFDAEALFWWKGRLFLLTKHRSDENTALYVFPEDWESEEQPLDLIRVSETTMGSMVTDAALSPDDRYLAVLTYAGITIFAAPDEGFDFLAQPVKRIDFHTNVTMQCEGLAWIGDSLYMTNEQRAIHRLHDPLKPSFRSYP